MEFKTSLTIESQSIWSEDKSHLRVLAISQCLKRHMVLDMLTTDEPEAIRTNFRLSIKSVSRLDR